MAASEDQEVKAERNLKEKIYQRRHRMEKMKNCRMSTMKEEAKFFVVKPKPLTFFRIATSNHQGDPAVFYQENLGKQCAITSLCAIVKSSTGDAQVWSRVDLEEILKTGDLLYGSTIKKLSEEGNAPLDGFLSMAFFHVLQPSFEIFKKTFRIIYDEEDTMMFGSLDDEQQIEGLGGKLLESLNALFEDHEAGLLIAEGYCYAVFRASSNGYVFFNSHAGDENGSPAGDGTASAWWAENIEQLEAIIKKTTGSKNCQYTLDFIDVHRV